jgi:hypothetical protein
VIGRSRKGFIQTEDEFKTARAHFEATKKDEYLLSCYRTFAEHGMGTLEEFEAAYGQKLIDPTAIPEFNAESEWEIAMDDLRAVLPSELIESLVLILLESAFASLREMTLLEAPGVGEAIQAIEAAAREWTPDTAELPAHIDLVLSHFGALMIPIALLALIPDRELVCELLRNNSLTISVADHLELVRNVVSALQIDMSRSAPLFHSSEIEFAGVIGESGQKLLAACEPDGDRMKSTVAWTISELI